MERESFENEDVGSFLNDNYVCIKVDREERPDVDRVYMNFIQARFFVVWKQKSTTSAVLYLPK